MKGKPMSESMKILFRIYLIWIMSVIGFVVVSQYADAGWPSAIMFAVLSLFSMWTSFEIGTRSSGFEWVERPIEDVFPKVEPEESDGLKALTELMGISNIMDLRHPNLITLVGRIERELRDK